MHQLKGDGQQLPLRRVLREDRSGSGLENTHQVNAFDELLVLLSLVVGQLSFVGFGGQLIEPGLRLHVELDVPGIPIPTPTIDSGVTLVSVMMSVPLFETGKVWVLEPPTARKLANVSVAAVGFEDEGVRL